MDKRLIWFALVVIMVVAAIFIFRNGCSKPVAAPATPGLVITPEIKITPTPARIQEGDSIYYEDITTGATSWYWDFSNGATSTQQSGYATYYTSGVFTIKLIINDSIMDSTYVEVLSKGSKTDGPSRLPAIIDGPKTAYVGQEVTFRDNTPGAEHTNWQNLTTLDKKRDSKTYTTTFYQKGSFTIVATNEKNTRQGSITVKVTDRNSTSSLSATKSDKNGKNEKVAPLPPDPPEKTHIGDADLKKLFSHIVTGKEEDFPQNYKPIKEAIQDESVPVFVKGTANMERTLYSFCQYLNLTHATIESVKSDWDATNGFKSITVIVRDNK